MLRSMRFSLAVVPLLLLFPAIAIAQPNSAQRSAPASVSLPPTDQVSPAKVQPGATAQVPVQRAPQAAPSACPAGQFASKFSDVPPNVWAYEAVNRIASGEFRCFPFASRS